MMQFGVFKNEIGPGVLKSSVQQIRTVQECQRHKPRATDYVLVLSLLYEILQIACFFNAELEYSKPNLVFEIRNNLLSRILYSVRWYTFQIRFLASGL